VVDYRWYARRPCILVAATKGQEGGMEEGREGKGMQEIGYGGSSILEKKQQRLKKEMLTRVKHNNNNDEQQKRKE